MTIASPFISPSKSQLLDKDALSILYMVCHAHYLLPIQAFNSHRPKSTLTINIDAQSVLYIICQVQYSPPILLIYYTFLLQHYH
jgi:hypothetical protein